MNINHTLKYYDNMFGKNSLNEISKFLDNKIAEAKEESDDYAVITLLNEKIGLCREIEEKEKGINSCKELIKIMQKLKLQDSIEYGTTLINIANLYRAFELFEKSLKTYNTAEKIYMRKLSEDAFQFASLYNNLSVLYQAMGDYKNSEIAIMKVLKIIDKNEEAYIEQAITKTNLACALLKQSEKNDNKEEAERLYNRGTLYLKEALSLFERDEQKDYHYSFALSAMGDAMCIKKRYKEAASWYLNGMKEIKKYVGESKLYWKFKEKYCRMQEFL